MTPLELKQAFKVMEARVRVLESELKALQESATRKGADGIAEADSRVPPLESVPSVKTPVAAPAKLCPKCGKKKAYFFHVKSCRGP